MNPGIMPSPSGYALPGAATRLLLLSRLVLRVGDTVSIPAGSFYDIIAIGAGASGGAASNPNGRACGGGGPGLSRDWGLADADFELTVAIGLGGLPAAVTSAAIAGNPGGLTTVKGGNVSLNIAGALPGQASVSAVPLLGGLGGVASGGKINRRGSRGGNITNTASGQKATGGGAIMLFGNVKADGARGGDILNALTSNQATGGGGVGGRGGDNPNSNGATAGGGAGGPASDGITLKGGDDVNGQYTTPNTQPTASSITDILLSWPNLEATASGATVSNAIAGAGAPGQYNSNSWFTAAFGGGGGQCNTVSNAVTGGIVAFGGGSGGVVGTGGYQASSGKAGDGLVIISIFMEQR